MPNNEPDVPGIPEDLWHMRNCDALVDPMEGDCTCGLAERKIIVLLENECRVKRDVIGAQLAQLATLRTKNAALEARLETLTKPDEKERARPDAHLLRSHEALRAIESLLSAEITERFGGHPSKSEAVLGRNSSVYALLVVPRNMARAALAETVAPPKDKS